MTHRVVTCPLLHIWAATINDDDDDDDDDDGGTGAVF